MLEIKRKVHGFLKKNGMDAESVDLEKNCKTFMDEMQKGLDGHALCLCSRLISGWTRISGLWNLIAVDAEYEFGLP